MKTDTEKEEVRFEHIEYLITLLLKIIGPVVLLASGLALLALRIAGWSIILGLPMVVIGVVFMIYTYDEILSKRLDHNHVHEHDSTVEEE